MLSAVSFVDTVHSQFKTVVETGVIEEVLETPAESSPILIAHPAIKASKAENGLSFVELARFVENCGI